VFIADKKYTRRKLADVTGVLFLMILVLGALFKILPWPGANILLVTSAMLFLISVPVGARYRYHQSQ
jgi:hypothetical protein